jgi:hypothetical protein
MNLASPLGLLALLAVPAIVFVHLFRRKLRERSVAALFLFEGERLVASAGRKRTRLLQTPSLWLECLAATALALWLAGPSFGGTPARHVVFVLDDSASMSVPATRAAARAALRDRAGELGSGDRVTLLRTGPRPEVLLGPRALRAEVDGALAKWRPARPRHDPLPALDLARELAADTGEVVFFTDERPPPGCDDLLVLAFGSAVPNAAILTAQRLPRADGQGEELRLRIGGYGTAEVHWAVHAGEQELLRQPLALTDGHGDVVVPLPPGLGVVRVSLGPDALALDDVAWLLPAPERTVAVCDVLGSKLGPQLELPRVFAALTGWRTEIDPLQSQLVLADQPGTPVAGQTEVVIKAGDGERLAWRGPFVIDRGHPWLAGLQLQGVVWLCGCYALPGQVLVAANDQALMTEEFLDTGRRLWIDVDPTAGNLMRSPDWPVLFANLIDACRAEVPGPEEPNVVIGGEARYRRSLRAGGPDSEVWLLAPDGSRQLGRGVRTVGWLVDQPGVHRVLGADGKELGAFAARFHDPAESDLRGCVRGEFAPAPKAPGEGRGSLYDTTFEQRVLGFVLLLLVLLDWWVLATPRGRA